MDAKATANARPVMTPAEMEGITATLSALWEQIRRGSGELQGLRVRAGEQLYRVREAFQDGAYGQMLVRLGIHRKKATRWIGEYCSVNQMPLPAGMAERSARSIAAAPNTNKIVGDTVSQERQTTTASDAGGFDVPDATPEQLAAMRAADGVDADGELVDDFEGALGSDMDGEEEEESDEGEGAEHTAQSTDEPASRGGLLPEIDPAAYTMGGLTVERVVQLAESMPVATVPQLTSEQRERLANTTEIVFGKPRSTPATGEQMRLDDLYAAAETAQGRLREIKAALTTHLDEHQQAAVARMYQAIEQAHAALAIGRGA